MVETKEKVKTKEEELEEALFYLKWGIDYWAKAFKVIPKEIKERVEMSAEYGYKHLAETITKGLDEIKKFEGTIGKETEKVYASLDETWNKINKKQLDIQKKIGEINNRTFNINTYECKEMLELLERLERYSPQQWKKFEVICSKLKTGGKADGK